MALAARRGRAAPSSTPPTADDVRFTGFLARRDALERQLGATADDDLGSEVERDRRWVARAYARWGEELSRHLLGEWAAVVVDAARDRVVLATDTLGLVPLFYSRRGEKLVVGSYLEEVVEAAGVGELDEEYVADILVHGRHRGRRTPYRHIRRLLPGECAVVTHRRISRRRIWDLNSVPRVRFDDPRDYVERWRELVREAVDAAVPGRGRVWCELSGGLDSSTILAAAVDAGHPVEAVSFVYPRSYTADESRWMRAVIDRHPVPWHPIDLDEVRPFTRVPSTFVAEPLHWYSDHGTHRRYTAELAEHSVDVVLTGQGGDAVMCGDGAEPYFLADLLRRGQLSELVAHARRWATAGTPQRATAYWLIRCGLLPAWRHLVRRPVQDPRARPRPAEWVRPRLRRRATPSAGGRQRPAWPRADRVADTYILERLVEYRSSYAGFYHRREVRPAFRSPLFYRPLVEFMLGVPWSEKLQPDVDRTLHRRAVARLLPRTVVERTDKLGPDQAYYEGLDAGHEWRGRLVTRPRVAERGWVDPELWRQGVERARLGRVSSLTALLATADVEGWLRQLESRSAPSDPGRSIDD